MATKRVHLATESGGRSRCRYTSRPSIRALFVSLEQFKATPVESRCRECAVKIADVATENLVFDLQPGETVCCYFCVCRDDHREYTKGEAFLAGPGHSPFDANANYFCRKHLDSDAVISVVSKTAARLVLLDGVAPADAARDTNLSPQSVSNVVGRYRKFDAAVRVA